MSALVISLDFELHWGVFDHFTLDESGRAYFDRTRAIIPSMLASFEAGGIHATWATVGLLFARSKAELEGLLPRDRPAYANGNLDPYRLLEGIGIDEEADPYHYAAGLIERVLSTPGQHLGSHTFSHYYCLEPGQTATSFSDDLAAAQRIARKNFDVSLTSLVFPRNQYAPDYLSVIKAQGFRSYRTNPDVWFWQAQSGAGTGAFQKAARFADHYLPLDQVTGYSRPNPASPLVDIPASRFFRPYLPKIDRYGGQRLKVGRICSEMTVAARRGLDYHLWWHPHNMATHPEKNMVALQTILTHFASLRDRYGMESRSMEECVTPEPQHG